MSNRKLFQLLMLFTRAATAWAVMMAVVEGIPVAVQILFRIVGQVPLRVAESIAGRWGMREIASIIRANRSPADWLRRRTLERSGWN